MSVTVELWTGEKIAARDRAHAISIIKTRLAAWMEPTADDYLGWYKTSPNKVLPDQAVVIAGPGSSAAGEQTDAWARIIESAADEPELKTYIGPEESRYASLVTDVRDIHPEEHGQEWEGWNLDEDEAEILRIAKKASEAESRRETICNLVNMAKHDEKKAIKFYKELRDKALSENKSLAEVIEDIMKDEEDHYEKLIEILNQCMDERPRTVGGHIYFE